MCFGTYVAFRGINIFSFFWHPIRKSYLAFYLTYEQSAKPEQIGNAAFGQGYLFGNALYLFAINPNQSHTAKPLGKVGAARL